MEPFLYRHRAGPQAGDHTRRPTANAGRTRDAPLPMPPPLRASVAPLAVPVAAAAEPLPPPSIPVNRAPPLLAIAREAIMAEGGARVGASARMREPRAPTDEHDERPIDRSMIDPASDLRRTCPRGSIRFDRARLVAAAVLPRRRPVALRAACFPWMRVSRAGRREGGAPGQPHGDFCVRMQLCEVNTAACRAVPVHARGGRHRV